MAKTATPNQIRENPFGLINMLGNVAEFCSDWYDADIYSQYSGSVSNPSGPASGEEYVIRGGSFMESADFSIHHFGSSKIHILSMQTIRIMVSYGDVAINAV